MRQHDKREPARWIVAARTVPDYGRSVPAAIPERKAKRWRAVRSCRRSRTSRRRGRGFWPGKVENLSEERERLLAREGSHHARVGDHRRLAEIDHSLGVLWDLRRRELADEYVGLDEDFLDGYVVSPGDDAPDDYRWRSEEHTSELQSRQYLVCRLLLEKK